MKLVLDIENTVTKRNGRTHLDPFEKNNSLVMVGMKADFGETIITFFDLASSEKLVLDSIIAL